MLLCKVRLENPESVKDTGLTKNPEITQKKKKSLHAHLASWAANLGTVRQVVSISELREKEKEKENGRILVSAVLAEDRPGRKRGGTTDQYGLTISNSREGREGEGRRGNAQPQF